MAEKIENNRIEQGFYSYPDTSAADRAAAEVERISRLEEQIDYSKPKVVHLLYDRINDSNVFASFKAANQEAEQNKDTSKTKKKDSPKALINFKIYS